MSSDSFDKHAPSRSAGGDSLNGDGDGDSQQSSLSGRNPSSSKLAAWTGRPEPRLLRVIDSSPASVRSDSEWNSDPWLGAAMGISVPAELDSGQEQPTQDELQPQDQPRSRHVSGHVIGQEPGQSRQKPQQSQTPPAGNPQLSGAGWVQIANSRGWVDSSLFSLLDSAWGPKAEAFVAGLRRAGAQVSVKAGLRHPKRAFLMHYAWGVAKGQCAPAQANAACQAEGIAIDWDHGNLSASTSAAQALVDAFGLVHQASLSSNHIRGLAIDMEISNLPGQITIHGKAYTTQRGASGSAAAASCAPIGRDMGVIWFGPGDWVHWSHNGR